MIRITLLAGILALWGGIAAACNPDRAGMLLPGDKDFLDAAKVFSDAKTGKYERIAAFETMLRVEGAAFGSVLRDGYLSGDPDIINAATYCETMRANGAVARVTGLPENDDNLNDKQKAQILSYSFTMQKAGADWSQGCLSTYKHPKEGCNPAYFISVRNGAITFRADRQTGLFRRVDSEFVGVIELVYGGAAYTVPAKLTLQ